MNMNSYHNPVLIKNISQSISKIAEKNDRNIWLMEVCGTHTHSIFHYGIRELLPENIELISGPGCPVCVTPMDFIDEAVFLARQPEVIVATFGDLMRVPGRKGSLLKAKAEGGNVEILYSPLDCLQIAQQNPQKLVVFLGVGFETTAPLSALTILEAEQKGITNFKILNAHKMVPPALKVLTSREFKVDGFILPGHVSAIIGIKPYHFLAKEHGIPGVITGFDPLDILYGIYAILRQLKTRKIQIENVYQRVVREEGNLYALEMLDKFFIPIESEWRGLGIIADSGLRLRDRWEKYDLMASREMARRIREGLRGWGQKKEERATQCICGLILTGQKKPDDCPSFNKTCHPESPLGACMVSSEGTCAAYYRYTKKGR